MIARAQFTDHRSSTTITAGAPPTIGRFYPSW
jgi:hypothetical protein